MKMHDVMGPAAEHLLDLALLQPRCSRLLRQNRRQRPCTTVQAVDRHVRVIGKRHRRRLWMEQAVGIETVHDVHVMALIAERMRQAVDVHRIAAEVVRRIERRQMQEIERPVEQYVTGRETEVC